MKIRPTLYVGLGTTGVEIINNLRMLNREEYGTTEYPIFRYISIETDISNDGTVEDFELSNIAYIAYNNEKIPVVTDSEPYPEFAKNKVLHTTIPSVAPIKEAIDPTRSVYNKHLAAWLSPDILDLDAVELPGGAGNIRMVGRLSLWENWNQRSKVQKNLHEAYDAIGEQENRSASEHSLRAHFRDAGITVDDTRRNVFIVGTLCGGTCSGMLLDIAYYFRHIGHGNTNIYGIFTMYDETLALDAPHIQMANCHASLVELDYYNQEKTEYNVTFPNGPTIRTTNAPFDVATFVSATGMKGDKVIDSEGKFDEDKLNKKVALDLFVRHLGVDAAIDADLVNAPAADNRFRAVRAESGCVQYMFSSGLQTKGYPKNHTAKAAATEFIKALQLKWEKRPPVGAQNPDDLYDTILDQTKGTLALDNRIISSKLALIKTVTEARNCLESGNHGGEFYKTIEGRVPESVSKAYESVKGVNSQEVSRDSLRRFKTKWKIILLS